MVFWVFIQFIIRCILHKINCYDVWFSFRTNEKNYNLNLN